MGKVIALRPAEAEPDFELTLGESRARIRRRLPGLAYAVSAGPGAVAIVLGGREVWVSPAEAVEFAEDVQRMAAYAERET